MPVGQIGKAWNRSEVRAEQMIARQQSSERVPTDTVLHRGLASRVVQFRLVKAHAGPRDLLRAKGLEEQVEYFGRHMSVEQAISQHLSAARTV